MKVDYEKWKGEYEPDMMTDDDRMMKVKEAIASLNSIQQKIYLTYVELGSYAAVGREYNVSRPTARKYIMEIKKKINDKLNLD